MSDLRFLIFTSASRVNLNPADTWQKAGDTACAWLASNDHTEETVVVQDTSAGNPWPFTTYRRTPMGYVGNPYKTINEALADGKGA